MVTQFQGAFSDNALRYLVTFLVLGMDIGDQRREQLVSMAGALFAVPFIDRDPSNRRRHLIFNIIGVIALLFIVVMTIVGYVT